MFCGPDEEELDEFAANALEHAAHIIDPAAFERCVPLHQDRHRDARAKAARVLLAFEAARLGVLRAA